MKKKLLLIGSAILGVLSFASCSPEDNDINPNLDLSKNVTLRLVSSNSSWESLDYMITKFETKYPNCSIVYEYVQDYINNIETRLSNTESIVDIFTSKNIQPTTEDTASIIPYCYNLLTEDDALDLSDTHPGLVENFKVFEDKSKLYCVPYGGEMRGMYVNKTLLKTLNLEVPKNRSEFLHCCEVLKNNGYVPLYSAGSICAQQLLYPYICNLIVHNPNVDYQTMYQKVSNIEEGLSEYFRDPYEFMYGLVEKGYYDDTACKKIIPKYTSLSKAEVFLNILDTDDTGPKGKEKVDDIGVAAFVPDTQSLEKNLQEIKSDYDSKIEYEFIMSPVGEDGGYAYLSPSEGFAVNKNSENIDWALEFLDFFFKAENNKEFCHKAYKLPNTKDALDNYNVTEDRTCQLGQVTFNYPFYKTIVTPLLDGVVHNPMQEGDYYGISKMNTAKAMIDDGNGGKKIALSLEDYMDILEKAFQKQKS